MKTRFLLFSFLTGCVSVVSAAEWTTTSSFGNSLDVTLSYSDNSTLSNNNSGQNGAILQLSPSFGIKGVGARMQVGLDYTLSSVSRADTTTTNANGDLSNFLNAYANIEVFEDTFFIDTTANAGVTTISSSGLIGFDTLTNSSNTTQTWSVRVSPHWHHHFGSYADLEVRVSADTLQNQSNLANDSQFTSVNSVLSSGKRFGRLGWSLSANQSWLDNQSGRTDKTSSLNLNANYRISRKYTLNTSVGYENNDFLTTQNSTIDGTTWNLGLTMTPNPRTSLKLSYGERFFGHDWGLDASWRHRRSTLTASYATSLTNSRTEQLSTITTPFFDINGNPVTIAGQQVFLSQTVPTLSNENIIQDQLTLAYQFSGKKFNAGVQLSYSDREFQLTGQNTRNTASSITASRNLTPDASINMRLSWTHKEDKTAGTDSKLKSVVLGYQTKVGKQSRFSVDLQRSENQGTATATNYVENRISATLGITI